jgi:predicted aspartyl protease
VETPTMGKVVVTAKIENVGDLYSVHQGSLSADKVRGIEVTDALVDTGATTLSVPKRLITQLGLIPLRTRTVRSATGIAMLQTYGGAHLLVEGRECTCDVTEVSDDCPVLIGQIPLEGLDLVVDTRGRRLIGNPEQGGEHIMELY